VIEAFEEIFIAVLVPRDPGVSLEGNPTAVSS